MKKGLNQENKIDQYDLSLYPIHNNLSGFMDGKALLWWVKEVFLPEVVRRRKIVGNLPVVLFWDAHSTRTNVAVRQWLQCNGVDMVILPVGMTSIFQPLDLVIFGVFIRQFRKWFKNGGKYEAVKAAVIAFQEAFKIPNIAAAWEKSALLVEDSQEIIDKYDDNSDPIVTSRRPVVSNVITAEAIDENGKPGIITLV